MAALGLPQLPAPLEGLGRYVADHPDTPMVELLQPYRAYESKLRQLYAQGPGSEALKDQNLNILPLYADNPAINVRARNLATESQQEKDRYIMPLPDDGHRKSHGSPAVVKSLREFKHNFNVFSESSLAELDWSNVVAAGSSVVNCLLPVPEEYNASKRSLREFYHEKFSPASDVDLFLYGLTEEDAIEKIRQIETAVRDAILSEVTIVRTKHAITICSQYPTRHVQIVLRIYKSVSEILTGFDIDCSCAAYDGKQVYCTPRALQSYITQINHIDLSRRSPSYENRLSKYSHRGFEVYWPDLDRSRIDPTIFERSFPRTLGLARLLVLERLPTSSARDHYLAKRREERGRPPLNRGIVYELGGNIKDAHEDEVAEWVVGEEEASNYHTFTIPYGIKFHAKKIEKLCYTRDLLLNAEWNQPEKREVYLHRHPAFFGRFDDVMNDCCGFCPTPETEEEKEVHEEESKIYVSGKISFIKDDPGRQQIGSFNPITDDDWTEMAYVGNTARLCQDIVDGELASVQDWLAQAGADPNTRDYTGRTPLHLAAMISTPDIVQCLVDRGARMVARLADGRTALHLAAERGGEAGFNIVKILMDKSAANEAEEEEKQAEKQNAKSSQPKTYTAMSQKEEDAEDSDVDMVDYASDDDEDKSMNTESFVKVNKDDDQSVHADVVPEENENDPDVYDVNVTAWDSPGSAMHFAILGGHNEIVRLLCEEYGADILLPVKFMDSGNSKPTAALLTLILASSLPIGKAKSMTETILGLGASCAQADLHGTTVLQQLVEENSTELLGVLLELDKVGVQKSINHIAFASYSTTLWPLGTAAERGDLALVTQLLNAGAVSQVDFETWLKAAKQSWYALAKLPVTAASSKVAIFFKMLPSLASFPRAEQAEDALNVLWLRRHADKGSLPSIESSLQYGLERNTEIFETNIEQPLVTAVQGSDPSCALELIKHGADVNSMTKDSMQALRREWHESKCETVLDIVRRYRRRLQDWERPIATAPALKNHGMDEALAQFQEGTWQHATVKTAVVRAKRSNEMDLDKYEKEKARIAGQEEGLQMKQAAIDFKIATLEQIEKELIARGGKTFEELHPGFFHSSKSRLSDEQQPQEWPKFKVEFSFHGVSDLTEKRRVKYIELFEAAWTGDLEKIKALTLSSWDPENNEPPLQIAVQNENQNPFSLAYLRGHHDVARSILEIAQVQFCPKEKPRARYRMQTREDLGSEDDGSDDDEPQIYRELVGEQFTLEDIGLVSMQVKSRVKPLDLLDWNCSCFKFEGGRFEQFSYPESSLLKHIINAGDRKGLQYYHDLRLHFAGQHKGENDEDKQVVAFPQWAFLQAVEQGRTLLASDMIKWAGAGLPLEQLVKKTGVELKEKPRYYQGLTVYGKKRKDWASKGRGVIQRATDSGTSPLLHAALKGSIESVEWFLSDAPLRCYLEFGKSEAAKKDARLQHLNDSPGGFDQAVTRWLGSQSDLIIHAAIMGPNNTRTEKLVGYLIKACPSSLEAKSECGMTPLAVASWLGRLNLVKILIANGADQSVKDKQWDNLIHVALTTKPTASELRAFLDLLDPKLRCHLLKERSGIHASDGRTPLHRWVGNNANNHHIQDDIDEMRVLLEFSDGEVLDNLDGKGETPLHTLIRDNKHPRFIQEVLQHNPQVLYRENAVGQTPADLIHAIYVCECMKAPNSFRWRWHSADMGDTLLNKSPEDFVEEAEKATGSDENENESVEGPARTRQIYDLVETSAEKYAGKRRLVSLHEANDVARRIGETYQGERYGWKGGRARRARASRDDDLPDEEEEEGEQADHGDHGDVVSAELQYLHSSSWEEPEETG